MDNWKHRSENMRCKTCMFFVPKIQQPTLADRFAMTAITAPAEPDPVIGRCRRHAPALNGFPVVFVKDWCGDHKLDEEKI